MNTHTESKQDLQDKHYWLRKFRMAKNDKTLERMVSRAIDDHHRESSVVAAIYLAECQRERELNQGRYLDS
ncbi:hypothetical protein MBH78_01280 [Oceanimonas sp. NS1]|uniref:Uncharacterized protein n=1 Tax=Oceanimonas doudoroffii TaxID=84158 RepID=A0A233RJB5_9GAMM|nr:MULTISPECIES: hypothetical protein [Oceanimonas]MCT7653808.1 hypothetical protein [Oceanimonas sp. NS1]NHH99917.1 hypothetical protein [Oceanimonas sp. MB9]OXY83479.1 hypothetical protein B6S08_08340 [Oceanimonas doudoroffii]